jgi:hypothetical protein
MLEHSTEVAIMSCDKCPTKVRRFSNTPQNMGSEIPPEKVRWARRMAARFEQVPGFREQFNTRFIEEFKALNGSPVDDEALSKKILADLGETNDPADLII